MAIPVFPGEVPGSGIIYKRGLILGLPIRDSLAAWFRYGEGITITGSGVSQWDDASGNSRHLKQGTDSARPVLQSDNSLLFDGSNDSLKCDAFTLAQPETVYLLARQVTWTLNDRLFDGNTSATGAIQNTGSSPTFSLVSPSSAAANSNMEAGSYAAIAAVFNGAASVLQVNDTQATTGNPGTNGMAGFTLGSSGGGTLFSNIACKEVIIYSAAHDDRQRSMVLRYLARVGRLQF